MGEDADWAGRGFSRKLNASESLACPSCGSLAEPEQDGDLTYFACECGHEFGYRRVVEQESTCQLGVPEEIRAGFSLAHLATLQGAPSKEFEKSLSPSETGVVFLGSLIPMRPEDN